MVRITYSSPGVKNRDIWGGLVPYDEIWRTGANEATILACDNALNIEGKRLEAGKYALFTIPGKEVWTIILNRTHDQWGASKYDALQDAARVTVKPRQTEHAERLTFSFEELDTRNATLVMRWDKTAIPIRIQSVFVKSKVRLSPAGGVSITLGDSTNLVIDYSRPSLRGRKLWGELIPYDKVWRTGANENTIFSCSRSVTINGEHLAAGQYGLHSIPGIDQWIIIFNKNAKSWGSYDYDEKSDALRVKVKPQEKDLQVEQLTFSFTNFQSADNGSIHQADATLNWGVVQVPFTVAIAGQR